MPTETKLLDDDELATCVVEMTEAGPAYDVTKVYAALQAKVVAQRQGRWAERTGAANQFK